MAVSLAATTIRNCRARCMSIKEKPHYTLSAASLAEWIERQPDQWWSVDGDPLLSSILDFPCPTDEIAPMLRSIGSNLLVQDKNPMSPANGEMVDRDKLDELGSTSNGKHIRT